MAAAGGGDFFSAGDVRVKICGVTNPGDASLAVEGGADAIGINLYEGSKRFVQLDDVADWVRDLPVTRIAVVVNATAEAVQGILENGCFDAIQFHGDESPEFCAGSGFERWVRAVRVRDADSLVDALRYGTPDLLLDAYSGAAYGGTGLVVERDLAVEFVRANPDRRVILAGGLTPENVADAVWCVRPAAVDVAGGVEQAGDPRRKDAAKMRDFVAAARLIAGG